MKRLKLLFILLLATVLVVACQAKLSPEEEALSLDKPGQKIRADKSCLSLPIPIETQLAKPGYAETIGEKVLLNQLYEGLVAYSGQGKIRPAAAETYAVDQAAQVYEFDLRPDLKWSDGSKVLAEDFKSAWISRLDPKNPSPEAFLIELIKGARDYRLGQAGPDQIGIEAQGLKLRISLEEPCPSFLDLLSQSIFFPEKAGLFNGAYSLELNNQKQINLVANPEFWDYANTRIRQVKLLKFEDSVVAYEAFIRGDLDIFGLPFFQVPHARREVASKRPEFLSLPVGQVSYLEFNPDQEFFKDRDFRHDLFRALDLPFMVRAVRYDRSEVLFDQKAPDSKLRKELSQNFVEYLNGLGLEQRPEDVFLGASCDQYLQYRELVALGKQWLDLFSLRLNLKDIKQVEDHQSVDFFYRECLYGTDNIDDFFYFLRPSYLGKAEDLEGLSELAELSIEYPVMPLCSLHWQVLVQPYVEGFNLPPNGLVRIQDLSLR